MKLIFEKLMPGSEEGFTFKEIRSRSFSCPWHFHIENELILTLHCPGYRTVGDDLTELEAGALMRSNRVENNHVTPGTSRP